ncbi:p-hydroxybenzoic acid efflux pump subunit aaeb [Nannochloropsis oceanica]
MTRQDGQSDTGNYYRRRSTSASNDTSTHNTSRFRRSSCASTAGGSDADDDDENWSNIYVDDDSDDSDCDSIGNPCMSRRFSAVMPHRVWASPLKTSTAGRTSNTNAGNFIHGDAPFSQMTLAALIETQAEGEQGSMQYKPSGFRSHSESHQHNNQASFSTASTPWRQRESSLEDPSGSVSTASRDTHSQKPTRPPRKHGCKRGPAYLHFRSKIEMAIRTASAAGFSTGIMLFVWSWAHSLSWFGVTLAISGTRKSLGETFMAAFDFWKGGLLVLPWIYALNVVRSHAILTLLGLFVSLIFIIWFPGVSDSGKSMATIFLTVVVLTGDKDPVVHYNSLVRDLYMTMIIANAFSVMALLLPLPLPSLALFDVRLKVKIIRHRLGSILRGYDHTFDLGQEVHYSMIEQLLEEISRALVEIRAQLPQVKWEMVVLRFKQYSHAHLVAYVETVEKQLELFKGMRLSLRRMSNNATHQEFLKYLQEPLSHLLEACVAVSDTATRQIESELVVGAWLRKYVKQRRQNQRLDKQRSREIRAEPRQSTVKEGGASMRQHRRQQTMSRAVKYQLQSRRHSYDLDSLFTIVESRAEVLMKEFVKARLAILCGFKAVSEDGMGDPLSYNLRSSMEPATTIDMNPTSVTNTIPVTILSQSDSGSTKNKLVTSSSAIRRPSEGSNEGGDADSRKGDSEETAPHQLAPAQEDTMHPKPQQPQKVHWTVDGLELQRHQSGQAVYNAFAAEYSKLGYFNVIPRHAFLLDICNYVRTLPILITACCARKDGDDPFSHFSSTAQNSKLPWSVWAKDKLIGWRGSYLEPALAAIGLLRKRSNVVESAAVMEASEGGRDAAGVGVSEGGTVGTNFKTAKTSTAATTPKASSHYSSSRGRVSEFQGPIRSMDSISISSNFRIPHDRSHQHHHLHHSTRKHRSTKGANGSQKFFSRLRQPVKVALAICLASLMVLYDVGPSTTWGVIAVCQAMSSHPGSSFKQGYDRIQGTVLGGMFGIVILDWFNWTSKLAILCSLTVWVFLCSLSQRSSSHGQVAVVAAATAPMIMIGPMAGGKGAMIRIPQTVLGSLLYVVIDNTFWPVRAKLDLRRELLASLLHFRELWGLTFSIFLQKAPDPVEAMANAQILHDTLTSSFSLQKKYISLAFDEPELFHKPFHVGVYQTVVESLSKVSLFMAMLVRSSIAFPLEVEERDRAMLSSIQGAVHELNQATTSALEEAYEAVKGMTDRKWKDEYEDRTGTTTDAAASPHEGRRLAGGRGLRNHHHNYHRRKRTTATPVLSTEAAQAVALLRLRQAYVKIQDWVDVYFEEHIRENWTKDDLVFVSADLILSLCGMIFAVEGLGKGLLGLGHAIRELVEREKGNYYRL